MQRSSKRNRVAEENRCPIHTIPALFRSARFVVNMQACYSSQTHTRTRAINTNDYPSLYPHQAQGPGPCSFPCIPLAVNRPQTNPVNA